MGDFKIEGIRPVSHAEFAEEFHHDFYLIEKAQVEKRAGQEISKIVEERE